MAGNVGQRIEEAHPAMATVFTSDVRAKPFLKWVGGKRQVLKRLRPLFPSDIKRYHEPFVGGGAVFFYLGHARSILSDTNQELIDCYTVVRDRAEELIVELGKHVYEKDHFYSVRQQDPFELDVVERAARMIYLNKTGFNGLYRVNSKGKFNVPFGRYENPSFCDVRTLRSCSKRLAGTRIECRSFEGVLGDARRGDFVYFDPPYIPLSRTANFTAYQRRGFGMENQEKLADVFGALAKRGVRVMLSNSDVPWIHERYGDHNILVIKAARQVNSDGSRRGPVGEVVVTSY